MSTPGLSFSIGGVPFGEMAVSGARCAKTWSVAPVKRVLRDHAPKTSGNLTLDDGDAGAELVCGCMYHGALAVVYGAYEADSISWATNDGETSPIYIVSPSGRTFGRCKYEGSDAGQARGTGNGDDCTLYVTYRFYSDEGLAS